LGIAAAFLAVYVAVHAVVAAFGVYYAVEAGQSVALSTILAGVCLALSALYLAAAVGLFEAFSWAYVSLVSASVALIVAVVAAVLLLGADWQAYAFEVAFAVFLCWFGRSAHSARNAAQQVGQHGSTPAQGGFAANGGGPVASTLRLCKNPLQFAD
jgi:hypothetical protein